MFFKKIYRFSLLTCQIEVSVRVFSKLTNWLGFFVYFTKHISSESVFIISYWLMVVYRRKRFGWGRLQSATELLWHSTYFPGTVYYNNVHVVLDNNRFPGSVYHNSVHVVLDNNNIANTTTTAAAVTAACNITLYNTTWLHYCRCSNGTYAYIVWYIVISGLRTYDGFNLRIERKRKLTVPRYRTKSNDYKNEQYYFRLISFTKHWNNKFQKPKFKMRSEEEL